MTAVVHAYSGNLYGGVEAVLGTLARHDGVAGMQARFALCFAGRLATEVAAAGARVLDLGPVRLSRPWTVWRARRRLGQALAAAPTDVVVTHSPWIHAVLAPALRRRGVRTVAWIHDVVGRSTWPERLAARVPPAHVVCNSRFTAGSVAALHPGVPTTVIHCPVEPAERPDPAERERVRAELGTAPGDTVIVQAGRLEPWKGHLLLADALARLAGVPGWTWWIVGGAQRGHEARHREALQAQLARDGIAGRVRFVGERGDARRVIAAADVSCQPSLRPEPFGVAIVEALAAGVPVVAAAAGGAVEIVDDTCGLLVPPGDASALAGALGTLLRDGERRRRLGAAGPDRARLVSDPAARLQDLASVLHRVVRA